MIPVLLLTGLLLAGAQADPISQPRKAYSTCVKKLMNSSLDQKLDAASFETALSSHCTSEKEGFRSAIIKQQLAMKASRKDAEQAATDWVDDQQLNAKEMYQEYLDTGTRPDI
jgi:hypothetical protein